MKNDYKLPFWNWEYLIFKTSLQIAADQNTGGGNFFFGVLAKISWRSYQFASCSSADVKFIELF